MPVDLSPADQADVPDIKREIIFCSKPFYVFLSPSLVTSVPVMIECQLKKSPRFVFGQAHPTQGFYEAIKRKWNSMQWNLTETMIMVVKETVMILIVDNVIS